MFTEESISNKGITQKTATEARTRLDQNYRAFQKSLSTGLDRDHCSAPGHLIRNISSGMFQKCSSYEVYTAICEIGVHFFE